MMVARAAALAAEIADATGRLVTGASFADIFGGSAKLADAAEELAA